MKLTADQVIEIYNSSKTLRELATMYNISHVNVYKIKAGKIHREITVPKIKSNCTYIVKCGDKYGYFSDGKLYL